MSNTLNNGEIFDDKFKIEALLGSGGTGSVYKALQIDSGRHVALKILHNETAMDEEYVARFLQEARALSKLSHPNIVTVYHLGTSPSHTAYLAMEYIKGQSVRAILDAQNCLPVLQSLLIVRDAARAMSYVHKCDIVHRDIKPENILLTDEPHPDTVKLVDFGLAKLSNQNNQKLTSTGQLIGTVKYMSPEQCMGQVVDFRTDIYSLSSCLYEMIVGTSAFNADNPIGIMYKQMNNEVPKINSSKVDQFHPRLNEIIAQGMAKDPNKRFASMDDMATQIDSTISLLKNSAPNKAPSKAQTKPLAFILVTFGLGLLLIGSFSVVQMENQKQRARQDLARFSAENANEETQFERKYKRSVARIEKIYGSNKPALAQHFDDLAEELWAKKKYREAEPLYKRSLAIKEGSSSFTTTAVFINMSKLGQCYRQEGKLGEAISLFKRLLAIQEQTESRELLHIAATLTAIGDCYREGEQSNEAIPFYKRSLACKEKSFEKDDADKAWTIIALALCYDSLGRYKEALSLYQEAVQLRQKTLEESDSDLCFSIERLALCYENLDRFKEAEALYKSLLQVRKKTIPLDYSLIGKSQCELAECYLQKGMNQEAEPLFTQGWPRIQSIDPSIINLLGRISECYANQGNFAESEIWYKRMLGSQQKLLASNPAQASSTNRLVQKTQQFLVECNKKHSTRTKAPTG